MFGTLSPLPLVCLFMCQSPGAFCSLLSKPTHWLEQRPLGGGCRSGGKLILDPRPPRCPLSWPLSVQRAAFSSLLLSRAARQHPSRAQAPQANRQPAHSREIQLQLPSRRPNLRPGAEAERASWRTMWVRVGAALREGAHRGQPHLPHSSPLFDPLVQPLCSHLGPGVCAQGAGHWSLQCSGGRMGGQRMDKTSRPITWHA